jgi:phage-related protein
MATELGKAYVQIVPSAEGIKDDIVKALGDEPEAAGKEAGASLGKGMLASAASALSAGAASIVSGITKAANAVWDLANDVASTADEIDKQSQKLGISAEAYQEWDAILQHSGTDISSMTAAMKTLTSAVTDGTDDQTAAFEALGISVQDAAAMSQEDLFSTVITGLQGMEEGADRSAIATDLLGRSATEMGALLNTSAEDTEAMREAVHELGGVMSNEAVAAGAAFEDALQDLTTIGEGFKNAVGSAVLPYITEAMTAITDGFKSDGIAGMAEAAVVLMDKFAKKVRASVPKLVSTAAEMMNKFAAYIQQNMGGMVTSGLHSVVQMVAGIAEGLPNLLSSAASMVRTLAKGVLNSLPSMAQAAGQVVYVVAKAIGSMISSALSWGKNFMVNLINGLIAKYGSIGGALKGLVSKFAQGIQDLLSKAWEWGKSFVSNLIAGLKGDWSGFTSAAADLADGISSYLSPDATEGPLADADSWMEDLTSSMAEELEDSTGDIETAAASVASAISTPITTAATTTADTVAETTEEIKTAYEQLAEMLSDSPLAKLQALAKAVTGGDWAGIGEFAVNTIYDGMSEADQTRALSTVQGWVQQLNDAYASGGYAGVIETGAAIAQTMAETLRDNSDTIWQAAADWCSGIAQAVSNALPALRSTAQSLGGTLSSVVANLAAAFPALGSAISVASTAMSGLNAVIAANPIGFILTAVFALVSALVGLSKTNTTVGKAIKSVWEGLKSVLDVVVEGILLALGALLQGWVTIINGLISVANLIPGVNIKKVSNVAFDLLDAWQNRGSSAETEAATDDAVQAIEANTEAVLGAKKTLDEMIAEANSLILSDNMALADTVAASGTASVAAAATSYNSRSTIITQNIYSKAQTAADLARETRWEYTRAALAGY